MVKDVEAQVTSSVSKNKRKRVRPVQKIAKALQHE